jgi:hypothetical protein
MRTCVVCEWHTTCEEPRSEMQAHRHERLSGHQTEEMER